MNLGTKWTARDEAQLEELKRRKEDVMSIHRAALHAAAKEIHGFTESGVQLDALIQQAGPLRDALEPFDNGIRPARPA